MDRNGIETSQVPPATPETFSQDKLIQAEHMLDNLAANRARGDEMDVRGFINDALRLEQTSILKDPELGPLFKKYLGDMAADTRIWRRVIESLQDNLEVAVVMRNDPSFRISVDQSIKAAELFGIDEDEVYGRLVVSLKEAYPELEVEKRTATISPPPIPDVETPLEQPDALTPSSSEPTPQSLEDEIFENFKGRPPEELEVALEQIDTLRQKINGHNEPAVGRVTRINTDRVIAGLEDLSPDQLAEFYQKIENLRLNIKKDRLNHLGKIASPARTTEGREPAFSEILDRYNDLLADKTKEQILSDPQLKTMLEDLTAAVVDRLSQTVSRGGGRRDENGMSNYLATIINHHLSDRVIYLLCDELGEAFGKKQITYEQAGELSDWLGPTRYSRKI